MENRTTMTVIAIVALLLLIIVAVAIAISVDQEDDEDIENAYPTAVAGENQMVEPGEMVYLDGTNSTDPDGDDLEYYWDLDGEEDADEDGNPTNDRDLTGAKVYFEAPMVTETEVITVTLTVSDGELESEDAVMITVQAGTEGPPDVIISVTYGDPVGLIADPHYILTIEDVSRLEPIADYSYMIKDQEDNIVLSGGLEEIINLNVNETVRFVDLATDPEGVGQVSEEDLILIRDTHPIEEGMTFHLRYLQEEEDAGMATLTREIVP
ncbi:MAG: PKD domain-containing protein [Thermoplasmatota archaeon]